MTDTAQRTAEQTGADLATRPEAGDVLTTTTSQREMTEAQGAMILAQKFPRDEAVAQERIEIACQRPGLAEGAIYTYARGGTNITGPSIRLAEAIAQNWGNLTFGIRELEQRHGMSTLEAFAWDLERNVRQIKTFQVPHTRHARGRVYPLETPRDIYEAVANQGARRMRACILGLIPGDVVEAAVTECERTLTAKADTSPKGIKKMLEAFATHGVTKEQIEARLQRKLDAMTPAQMVGLGKIHTSLKDGMSGPAGWFDAPEGEEAPEEAAGGNAKARQKLERQAKKAAGKSPEPPEDPPQRAKAPAEAKDLAPPPEEATAESGEAEEAADEVPEPDVETKEGLVASIKAGFVSLGLKTAPRRQMKYGQWAREVELTPAPPKWEDLSGPELLIFSEWLQEQIDAKK